MSAIAVERGAQKALDAVLGAVSACRKSVVANLISLTVPDNNFLMVAASHVATLL